MNGTSGKHRINPEIIGMKKSSLDFFFFFCRKAKSPKTLNTTKTKPIVCSKINKTENKVSNQACFLQGNSYILIDYSNINDDKRNIIE